MAYVLNTMMYSYVEISILGRELETVWVNKFLGKIYSFVSVLDSLCYRVPNKHKS